MHHVDSCEHILSVITYALHPTEEARTTISVMGLQTHEAKDQSRLQSIKNKEKTLRHCDELKMDKNGLCFRASILVD